MKRLAYEEWILDSPGDTGACPVKEALLETYNSARKLVSDLTADDSIESFVEAQRIISKNADLLTSMDPSFHLELGWLEKAGDALDSAMTKAALSALPTAMLRRSYVESLNELSELMKSKMYLRSAVAAREQVLSLQGFVGDMRRGVTPILEWGGSSQASCRAPWNAW